MRLLIDVIYYKVFVSFFIFNVSTLTMAWFIFVCAIFMSIMDLMRMIFNKDSQNHRARALVGHTVFDKI